MCRPAQDSSVWLESTGRERLMSPECSKHRVLGLAKKLLVNKQNNLFFSLVFSRVLNEQIQRVYINRHLFRSAQDSSVWLGLMGRERLMSPECSKYHVLSLAKMLVVNKQNNLFSLVFSRVLNEQIQNVYIHRHV